MSNARQFERNIIRKFRREDPSRSRRPEVLVPIDASGRLDAHLVARVEELRRLAARVVDPFDALLYELLLTDEPGLKQEGAPLEQRFGAYRDRYLGGHRDVDAGSWAYYPNGTLLHLLRPDDHYRLRTSRNLGLFTAAEQERFRNVHVAIGGLSVGSMCAVVLAMEGVRSFYLTDFDLLSCSNLNRLNAPLSALGVEKTRIVAERLWDVDPFMSLELNDDGFQRGPDDPMFKGPRRPDVVIDAMDSMDAKMAIRVACHEHRIPLVTMIDIGDGVVQVGVERHDLDPNVPPFHGRLLRLEETLRRTPTFIESVYGIFDHDHLPFRQAASFQLACQYKWPGVSQLAGTVSLAASAVSRVVRRILLGQPVTNEFFVDIDRDADPAYAHNRAIDREKTYEMLRGMGVRRSAR